jgi:hypothetical protein
MVVGADRLCYRVQGTACPGTVLPSGILNDCDNNVVMKLIHVCLVLIFGLWI